MRFCGMSPDGVLPDIIEHADHPWFIGVQFHPELKSRPFAPHPCSPRSSGAAVEQSRLVQHHCNQPARLVFHLRHIFPVVRKLRSSYIRVYCTIFVVEPRYAEFAGERGKSRAIDSVQRRLACARRMAGHH